ncbi:hypothetical protein Avbf_16908 [Armadillidium vulgare]|nr:hypothetical protein Avbf_16908 [Armadillidium vulgare]
MAVMLLNFDIDCEHPAFEEQQYTSFQTGINTLYLFPINEDNLALKKPRLPEAPLRSIFQKEKICWARHCQDKERVSKTVSSRVTYPILWHPFIKRSAPSTHLIPFIKFSNLGLKLPNLFFVDEHSTCFTGNYLLHFLGPVYSLSAIRRGVSNQNTLEYCTDKYMNLMYIILNL